MWGVAGVGQSDCTDCLVRCRFLPEWPNEIRTFARSLFGGDVMSRDSFVIHSVDRWLIPLKWKAPVSYRCAGSKFTLALM